MIDLYTWSTPNGRKISIALEELKLPYKVFPIDISNNENDSDAYSLINPHKAIPAIVDQDTGIKLSETGAILCYLADKAGQLWPQDKRWAVLQWVMWQVSALGPYFGQMHHFVKHNPGVSDYGVERFVGLSKKVYKQLDTRLSDRAFVVDDYSIADIAIWPWVARYEWHPVSLDDYPNVKSWYLRIVQREAVQRGYKVPKVEDVPLPG